MGVIVGVFGVFRGAFLWCLGGVFGFIFGGVLGRFRGCFRGYYTIILNLG